MPFGDEIYVDSGAYRDFIAGAEWQKKQLVSKYERLCLDVAVDNYDSGKKAMREQMMKEAAEVDVADLNGEIYNNCIEKGMTDEDKVKIIIIKYND